MRNKPEEKIGQLTLLFDFYGELLTERQREIVSLFLEEDLSLGEIASELGISRQAAHDAIKRGQELLYAYEKNLGLVARFLTMKEELTKVQRLIEKAMPNHVNPYLQQALSILQRIRVE